MSKSLKARLADLPWDLNADASEASRIQELLYAYESNRKPMDIALDNLAEDLLRQVHTLMMFREGLPSEGKVKAMFIIAFRKAMGLSSQEVSLEKESELSYHLRIGKLLYGLIGDVLEQYSAELREVDAPKHFSYRREEDFSEMCVALSLLAHLLGLNVELLEHE